MTTVTVVSGQDGPHIPPNHAGQRVPAGDHHDRAFVVPDHEHLRPVLADAVELARVRARVEEVLRGGFQLGRAGEVVTVRVEHDPGANIGRQFAHVREGYIGLQGGHHPHPRQ